MAEAVVSPLIESLLIDPRRLNLVADRELHRIESRLRLIVTILGDKEREGATDAGAAAFRHLLRKIKDVGYDADDVLDELEETWQERDDPAMISSSFSARLRFRLKGHRHKAATKLMEIRGRLDEILEWLPEFCPLSLADPDKNQREERPPTLPYLTGERIYGREEDTARIIELLLPPRGEGGGGRGVRHHPCVVAIVGMGGLGKTTLAQVAYNDADVVNNFDLRIWICFSNKFMDVERQLIESITRKKVDRSTTVQELQSRIAQIMDGKKYLLVLDDVWGGGEQKFCELKSVLARGAEGSKIIMTTRSRRVAHAIGGDLGYHLEPLSDNDCWNLFLQRAFADSETGEAAYPSLKQIGREIARKFGGVPLAAKALGSAMLFNRDEKQWEYVEHNEICTLPPEFQEGILSPLRLSYTDLALHLRECFAYCSIFPKGCKLEKETLIQLWAAVGFIRWDHTSRPLEDIGNDYFRDLLERSFFQDPEKDELGNVSYCRMHFLMHDLAHSVAGDECFALSSAKMTRFSIRARHLLLLLDDREATFPPSITKANKIRTFLFSRPNQFPVVDLTGVLSSFKCLRALFISQDIVELPSPVCDMIHLRYLDIRNTLIGILPEYITKLKHLQTIKLGSCFKMLPSPVCRLMQLLTLDIGETSIETLPENITCLEKLENLTLGSFFKELPSPVCKLRLLQCLDIRYTSIEKLPEEMRHKTNFKLRTFRSHFEELPQE